MSWLAALSSMARPARSIVALAVLMGSSGCRGCRDRQADNSRLEVAVPTAPDVLPEGDCHMAMGLQRGQELDVALACDNGLFTTAIVDKSAQRLRHWPLSGRLLGYHWDIHGCDALVAGPSEYDAVGLRGATTVRGPDNGPIVRHVRAWTFADREVWADLAGLHSRLGARPVGSLNVPAAWNTVIRLREKMPARATKLGAPRGGDSDRIVMIADQGEFGCGLVEVVADASLHRLDCPTTPTERIVGARALPSEGPSCLEYVAGDLLKTAALRVGVHCLDGAPGVDAGRTEKSVSLRAFGLSAVEYAWYEGSRWFALTPSGRVASFGDSDGMARAEVPSEIVMEGSVVIRYLGAHLVEVIRKQRPVPGVFSCAEP